MPLVTLFTYFWVLFLGFFEAYVHIPLHTSTQIHTCDVAQMYISAYLSYVQTCKKRNNST